MNKNRTFVLFLALVLYTFISRFAIMCQEPAAFLDVVKERIYYGECHCTIKQAHAYHRT